MGMFGNIGSAMGGVFGMGQKSQPMSQMQPKQPQQINPQQNQSAMGPSNRMMGQQVAGGAMGRQPMQQPMQQNQPYNNPGFMGAQKPQLNNPYQQQGGTSNFQQQMQQMMQQNPHKMGLFNTPKQFQQPVMHNMMQPQQQQPQFSPQQQQSPMGPSQGLVATKYPEPGVQY